jgi:hypothetical protein
VSAPRVIRGSRSEHLPVVREGQMVCEHARPVGVDCPRCAEMCRDLGHYARGEHPQDSVCAFGVKEYHPKVLVGSRR